MQTRLRDTQIRSSLPSSQFCSCVRGPDWGCQAAINPRAKLGHLVRWEQATKKRRSAGPSLKAAPCARYHSGDCSSPSSSAFWIWAHGLVIDVSHLLPGFLFPGLCLHLLDLQGVCLPPPHEEVVVSDTQLKNLFQSRVKSGEKQLYMW